ncbi:MAG: peptide deformylase [Proteobacteria bacterium]|nr:peptide deformylase [Pseudomonadota bacterium]
MIKKIITYPNLILAKKAATVTDFDEDLRQLIVDMVDTMFDAPGAGLAANQIGVSKQVVVINVSEKEKDADRQSLALINPEIIHGEGSQVDVEGCLSVIEYSTKVERFQKIVVRAFDITGKECEFEAEDFFARVIQHECDHLEGKLFIDRISSLKRTLYKKKLKKILAEEKKL